jgi:hypothetical protein
MPLDLTADNFARLLMQNPELMRSLIGGRDRPDNLAQARQKLNLNPQEVALYQMHLSNLYGRGGVDNPDGTRSSLFQTSVEIDGKTYNIPTVWDGKILPPEQAIARAQEYGFDKFPSYSNPEQAQSRYDAMHDYMEKDTKAYQAMPPDVVTALKFPGKFYPPSNVEAPKLDGQQQGGR